MIEHGIEGAMVCTSLGMLRPLFYFLCSILLIHRYSVCVKVSKQYSTASVPCPLVASCEWSARRRRTPAPPWRARRGRGRRRSPRTRSSWGARRFRVCPKIGIRDLVAVSLTTISFGQISWSSLINHLQNGDAAVDKDLVADVRLLLSENAIAAAIGDLMAARVGHRVIPADGCVPGEGEGIPCNILCRLLLM